MNPLFENKTTITKEVLAEFAQKSFKIYHKKYRIFVLLMSIITICFAIVFFIIDGLSWAIAIFLLAAAFFLFMFFKAYTLKLNQTNKSCKGLYGGSPQILSRFYEEKIESITSISTMSIEYSKITKVIETKNLLILMIEYQGLIVDKSGFINGDFNSFKSFINEKCKHS